MASMRYALISGYVTDASSPIVVTVAALMSTGKQL
jgi:hypothetical protein